MAFTKIKPGIWFKKQTIQSSEITQLDQKLLNSFDLRSGQTNTIYDDITFQSGSNLTLSTLSNDCFSLDIDNFIVNNNIKSDAIILGKTAALSFGYYEETITAEGSKATGRIIFSNDAKNNGVFQVQVFNRIEQFNIADKDTPEMIATACANAINNGQNGVYMPVVATVKDNIVTLTAKTAGVAANSITYVVSIVGVDMNVTAFPTVAIQLTAGKDPIHIISNAANIRRTVKLVGDIDDNCFVVFPSNIKYEKVVINSTNKSIKIKDLLNNIIEIPVGRTLNFYCDGSKIYQIGSYNENTTTEIYQYASTGNHGDTVTTFSSTTFITPTSNYYKFFDNVGPNDLFDISYGVRTYNSSASGWCEFIIWINSESNVIFSTKQQLLGSTTAYLSWRGVLNALSEYSYSGVGLACRVSAGTGYLLAPTDFNVRHIRA